MGIFGKYFGRFFGVYFGVAQQEDSSLCLVTLEMEALDGRATNGVTVVFKLVLVTAGAAKSDKLIDQAPIHARMINGVLKDRFGGTGQHLQRNDGLTPAGSQYEVSFVPPRFEPVLVTLAASTFDLGEIVGS